MNPEDVERVIEDALPDAHARVTTPRPNDTDHLAAEVVSPAFEGKSLVDQHSLVYDAVDEHLTTDIHALKVTTYTPEKAPPDAPDQSGA
ncbi:BolA family protein [Halapricum salinum]|uniref:BolA family transcriptional regulator n=1 Tax=Halapricum salinum TaxID=1457250 RepID=A0A4D6HF15_9EURY|nr:BolA/IbaG family iron-sulfur metabolism protein [Halapricum salinum]QCC52553.1 BolA family transcriptional regulator [Halapricum salinum]